MQFSYPQTENVNLRSISFYLTFQNLGPECWVVTYFSCPVTCLILSNTKNVAMTDHCFDHPCLRLSCSDDPCYRLVVMQFSHPQTETLILNINSKQSS